MKDNIREFTYLILKEAGYKKVTSNKGTIFYVNWDTEYMFPGYFIDDLIFMMTLNTNI